MDTTTVAISQMKIDEVAKEAARREEFINRIKQVVSQDYDNINHPEPFILGKVPQSV